MTLAEVVIVLGIVGVVAAYTIPNLVKNYQSFVLKNQFKKSYSMIYSAISSMKTDNGIYPACYYEMDGLSADSSECRTVFWPELIKKLRVSKTCMGNAYSGGCIPRYNGGDTVDPNATQEQIDYFNVNCGGFSQNSILNLSHAWVLADGTILFTYATGGRAIFAIDINGFKKPNKWGQDLFSFGFHKDQQDKTKITNICQPIEGGGVLTSKMIIDAFK